MPILIDGHNLIGQMSDISLEDPDDEAKLVQRLRAYRAHTGKSITVIFDNGGFYSLPSNLSSAGIRVRFAPLGSSADALLIKHIRRAANPRGLKVVSSDQAVVRSAREHGVHIISASTFAAELSQLGVIKDSPERRLSPEEVAEWLKIFGGKDKRQGRS